MTITYYAGEQLIEHSINASFYLQHLEQTRLHLGVPVALHSLGSDSLIALHSPPSCLNDVSLFLDAGTRLYVSA